MEHEITENPLRGVEAKVGSGHYGVFDHGAHVWSWQPDGAAPVIWMSAKSWFSDGQPIRGGVPICFPWFGPGRAGDQLPIHGFARLHTWHLADLKDTLDRDGRLIAVYTLDNAMTGEQPDWPHRYEARYVVKFTTMHEVPRFYIAASRVIFIPQKCIIRALFFYALFRQ